MQRRQREEAEEAERGGRVDQKDEVIDAELKLDFEEELAGAAVGASIHRLVQSSAVPRAGPPLHRLVQIQPCNSISQRP
jgi:hypothetical protein